MCKQDCCSFQRILIVTINTVVREVTTLCFPITKQKYLISVLFSWQVNCETLLMNSFFHACPFIFSSSCTGGLNVLFLPITHPPSLFKSHQAGCGCQGTPLPTHHPSSFQGKLKWRIFYSITKQPPLWFLRPNKLSVLTIVQNLGGKGRVRPPHGSSRMGDRRDASVPALREQE